jgi:lipoprotein-anchoring transpeptidase ErfK/SrfK
VGRQGQLLVAIAVVLIAAIGAVAITATVLVPPGLPSEGGQGKAVAAVAPPTAPPTTLSSTPAPPAPPPTYIGTLNAPTSYSASPGGPPVGNLAATNPFGAAQVVALVDPPDGSGWLHVELPVRPNGSTGWIPAQGVALAQTSYKVTVSLAARTLTITNAGQVVLTAPVAVGAPSTPTPPDQTYLWELIRPDNPNGAYGPYIFGLAEFSDTYATFNGGDAQIGIHGQDEPWTIGKAASHGCVHLPNDVIIKLAEMLPLGTPVAIS